MTYFKLDLKESGIHGKGLFAQEPIARGSLVLNWTHNAKIVREAEHLEKWSQGLSAHTIRLAGDLYIYADELTDQDHVNHSENPNLLCHCGLLFARKDIAVGEELTLDYHYLNSAKQVDVVQGYPAKFSLMTSAQELLQLFESENQ